MANPSQPDLQDQEPDKLLRNYQAVQDQLRGTAMQLDQLQNQKIELDRAREEVTNATGKVYVTIGGVIVETDKVKALNDIKERTEVTDVRIASVNRQFSDLKAKEKQLGEKITELYKRSQGSG